MKHFLQSKIDTIQNLSQKNENMPENYIKADKYFNRIWEIDALKVIAFLCMFFGHLMFDVAYIFGRAWNEKDPSSWLAGLYRFSLAFESSETFVYLTVFFSAGLFLFLSGVSCNFSKNNLLRGIKTILVAVALYIVTSILSKILDVNLTINFGIIACLGVCMLLGHFFQKADKWILLPVAVLVAVLGFIFSGITVSFEPLVVLNFNVPSFSSADYYPLFPFMAFFLVGIFVGSVLYPSKQSLLKKINNKPWTKPFKVVSSKLLLLYFLHQIFLFALLFLVNLIYL